MGCGPREAPRRHTQISVAASNAKSLILISATRREKKEKQKIGGSWRSLTVHMYSTPQSALEEVPRLGSV